MYFLGNNCWKNTFYPITSDTVYADVIFVGRYFNALSKPQLNCGENMTVNAIILDTFPNRKTPNTPTEKETEFPIDEFKIPIPRDNGFPPSFFDAKQTISYDNKLDKKYIRYLFDSKMGCGSIASPEVYYYKRPSITILLTVFGDINAPSYSEKEKDYQGKCVDNAVNVGDEKLMMKCTWNGTVTFTTGQCICLQGYEKEQNECKSKWAS